VYLVVDGVKYWIMPGPSGFLLYRKRARRRSTSAAGQLEEVKEMLAKAGAEAVQKIKTDVEAVKQVWRARSRRRRHSCHSRLNLEERRPHLLAVLYG
jgi:hypothetical protein